MNRVKKIKYDLIEISKAVVAGSIFTIIFFILTVITYR